GAARRDRAPVRGGRVALPRAALERRREPRVLQGERHRRLRGARDRARRAAGGGALMARARTPRRKTSSARTPRRRYLLGMTGASGSVYGVDFVRRCPGEKYLVMSDWARQVLHTEVGLKPSDLEPHVRRVFADADLAAPFASGSNRYDAFVVIPCSV